MFLLKHLNYVHSEIYRCHHSPSADWLFINLCTIYLQKTYSQWYNYSRINLNQLHSHQNNSSLSIWMVHKSSLSICDTSCKIILGGFLGFVGFLDGLRGSAEAGLVLSYVLSKNILTVATTIQCILTIYSKSNVIFHFLAYLVSGSVQLCFLFILFNWKWWQIFLKIEILKYCINSRSRFSLSLWLLNFAFSYFVCNTCFCGPYFCLCLNLLVVRTYLISYFKSVIAANLFILLILFTNTCNTLIHVLVLKETVKKCNKLDYNIYLKLIYCN